MATPESGIKVVYRVENISRRSLLKNNLPALGM